MIPAGWLTSTLGELCDIVKGTTAISKCAPGPYPLITTGEEHRSADHYQLIGPAVCVPLISSTGHGHASLKRIHYVDGKFALANLLAALVVREPARILPRFLHAYLSYHKDQLIVPLMVGAANMSLNPKRLASIPVKFPSLTEQQRIVEMLSAGSEVQKLCGEAKDRTKDILPAMFQSMFGNPVTNTKNWPIRKFSDICSSRLGKMLDKKQQSGEKLRPYLRNANVQWFRLHVSDLRYMDFEESERETFRLRRGDILICEGGDIGRSAIWNGEIEECYYQKALHRVRPDLTQVLPEFIVYLMESMSRNGGFREAASGATIAHLTGVKLRKLQIPVPPLALQHTFAQYVAEVRETEAQRCIIQQEFDNLIASMLHRAFRGDL